MTLFPLSAIVGQEALVEALLINAVAPDVGGVLVRGQRGTAKSTAVRALAPLLPAVDAAVDEAFAFAPGERGPAGLVPYDVPVAPRPAPLVEVPLGATLDRLVGALDLGRALAGEQAFEPGLLARAHQGILYVDEVNLLPDHLVDALLDAAASGVARVERDAVSVEHDARFLLVGTMNVEEGDLRPQLLDRFGLGVDVRTPEDPAVRAEIVRRRLAFERDPAAFAARWGPEEDALAARVAVARDRLGAVRLPERELLRITGACAKLGVDGVRGDIVCARAARALAALDGADEVTEEHVRRATRSTATRRRTTSSTARSTTASRRTTGRAGAATAGRRGGEATATAAAGRRRSVPATTAPASGRRRGAPATTARPARRRPATATTTRATALRRAERATPASRPPTTPPPPPVRAATRRRPPGCRSTRCGSRAPGAARTAAEPARPARAPGRSTAARPPPAPPTWPSWRRCARA